MDTAAIIKVAVATVGVTQLLKNILTTVIKDKGNKIIWTIITILCGVGMTVVQCRCPTTIMDGIIAVSGATVFYDTIYKSFEQIFQRGNNE